MSTSNTLRNMALIFSLLQDGFNEGFLELEFIDVVAKIKNKKYIMEAKSARYSNYKKSAKSNDLSIALAQISARAFKDQDKDQSYDFGVIVTNVNFQNADKENILKPEFYELKEIELKQLFAGAGFKEKMKQLKATDISANKKLKKYYILVLFGENDEEIRAGMKTLVEKHIGDKVKYNKNIISLLIDTSDKILETMSEKKTSQKIKYDHFKFWFLARKDVDPSSIQFNDDAKILFENEKEFNVAIDQSRNHLSLKTLDQKLYQVLMLTEEIKEFISFLKEYDGQIKEKIHINIIKINWLQLKNDRSGGIC